MVSSVRCGYTLANRAALAARPTLGRPAIAWTTFETVLVNPISPHVSQGSAPREIGVMVHSFWRLIDAP